MFFVLPVSSTNHIGWPRYFCFSLKTLPLLRLYLFFSRIFSLEYVVFAYFYKLTEQRGNFHCYCCSNRADTICICTGRASSPRQNLESLWMLMPHVACPVNRSQGTEGQFCAAVSSYHIISSIKSCPSLVYSIQVTKCLARCSAGTSHCPLHLAGDNSEVPGGKNKFAKPIVWESVAKKK